MKSQKVKEIVYTVLSEKGEIYFSNKEEAVAIGHIYSTRTFTSSKAYAQFYFSNNNKDSKLNIPTCNILSDIIPL